jgi:LAO/AO transport system kinase
MIILIKRLEQNEYWMLEAINEQLKGNFYNNTEIQIGINKKAVQNGEISPFAAAQFGKKYLKNKPSYII